MADPSDTFSNEDAYKLEVINVFCSVLSLCGSLFIVYCYARFKELRTFAMKLIFWISFSDIFFSVGNLLGDAGGNDDTHFGASKALCQTQSFLISFFGLSSILWTATIAHTLQVTFLRPQASNRRLDHPGAQQRERLVRYHYICWGLPLLLSILPFTTDSYADSGGWCWIDTEKAGTAWRFVQLYVPLWVVIVYNAYVFRKTHAKLAEVRSNLPPEEAKHYSNVDRIKLYPLVLLISYSFATVNALYQAFSGGAHVLWLNGFHVFFASLTGLMNAAVFGSTPAVRRQVLRMSRRNCCGCFHSCCVEPLFGGRGAGEGDDEIDLNPDDDKQGGAQDSISDDSDDDGAGGGLRARNLAALEAVSGGGGGGGSGTGIVDHDGDADDEDAVNPLRVNIIASSSDIHADMRG